MPVNLAHLAHYLSQHFAVFCCPVELSLSIKLSSPVELSETAVSHYMHCYNQYQSLVCIVCTGPISGTVLWICEV